MKTTGTKYEATQGMDIAEIAKLVRKDIKAAHKGVKCSVRISRYSMGRSLDVEIKTVPAGTELADLVVWQPHTAIDSSGWWRPSCELLDSIQAIVDAYNRKDIDSMTDYYNVRFHDSVKLSHDLLDAARDAAQARLDAVREASQAATQALEADVVELFPSEASEPVSGQVELLEWLGIE